MAKLTCSEVTSEVSADPSCEAGMILQKCPRPRQGNWALPSLHQSVIADREPAGGSVFLGRAGPCGREAVPFEGHVCEP